MAWIYLTTIRFACTKVHEELMEYGQFMEVKCMQHLHVEFDKFHSVRTYRKSLHRRPKKVKSTRARLQRVLHCVCICISTVASI